ncbi:MAG: GEVED domain-containing protein [Planctomycetota bacterium]|jgi:hypothetical protein
MSFSGNKKVGMIGLVSLLAIFMTGQLFGDTTVTYELAIGGDNHVADWELGTRTAFTPGNPDDGQRVAPNSTITWEARAAISGVQTGPPGEGYATGGLANFVFHLELHEGSAGGPPASGAQFKSTINDGDGGDPLAAAAFPLSVYAFTPPPGGDPARVIDPLSPYNGPNMAVYTYPTYDAGNATLFGMGAGYKQWCTTCGGATYTTPGVGLAGGLGVVPISEGQIDLTGLPEGVYVLKLSLYAPDPLPPHGPKLIDGVNSLRTDPPGLGVDRDAFATAADVTNNEDTITFEIAQDRDWGDALDSYGTLSASSGPNHIIGNLRMGANIDPENDGKPSAGAVDDDNTGTPDDEDGVTIPALLEGRTDNIVVNASAAGLLDAWIDFNGNGVFDHPAEHLGTPPGTSIPVVAGANNIAVTPALGTARLDTYARFRISTAGGLSPLGPANDGEVEDYNDVDIIAQEPIQLVSMVSKKYHSGDNFSDYRDRDLPLGTVGSECRIPQGMLWFVLTFDQNIVVEDGSLELGDEVVAPAFSAGAAYVSGLNTIDLQNFADLPNKTCVTVQVSGIKSDTGGPLVGDTDVHFRIDYCDVKPEGIISLYDLGLVKSELFQSVINANCKSNLFNGTVSCP